MHRAHVAGPTLPSTPEEMQRVIEDHIRTASAAVLALIEEAGKVAETDQKESARIAAVAVALNRTLRQLVSQDHTRAALVGLDPADPSDLKKISE